MWKVVAINNHNNKVALVNESGDKLRIVIPLEHTTNAEKQAYMKGHSDGYDRFHKPAKNSAVYILSALALVEALGLLWHVLLH